MFRLQELVVVDRERMAIENKISWEEREGWKQAGNRVVTGWRQKGEYFRIVGLAK